jgi:hypothetical protein
VVAYPRDVGFLLATGSRIAPLWLRHEVLTQLSALAEEASLDRGIRRFLLLDGDAYGVDKVAGGWTRMQHPWEARRKAFPATWSAPCEPHLCTPNHRRPSKATGEDFCPAQGSYRNGRMVEFVRQQYHENNAWAVVAAFYQRPKSEGTADCVRQARAAGLEVREFGNAPESAEKSRQALP